MKHLFNQEQLNATEKNDNIKEYVPIENRLFFHAIINMKGNTMTFSLYHLTYIASARSSRTRIMKT